MDADSGVGCREALKSAFAALPESGACSPASTSVVRTSVKSTKPTIILSQTLRERVLQHAGASWLEPLLDMVGECCIVPRTTGSASTKIGVGEHGIHRKFALTQCALPPNHDIITLEKALCSMADRLERKPAQGEDGQRNWGRALSQFWPSKGVTDIDSMVLLSMQRALTLTPSGCDRGI